MRLYFWISFILLLTFALTTTTYREHGGDLENLTNSMEHIQEVTFNLTSEAFQYKNPYSGNFTVTDFVFNTIHGVLYALTVELNTAFGISINWFYKNLDYDMAVNILKFILSLALIWFISKSVVPIGAIYVFYEDILEKKKKKIKRYWIMSFAIVTWLLICALFILCVWWFI